MNVKFKNISIFKEIVDALSSLLSEGTFVFTKEGVRFEATDPTMVTLVKLFYSKNNFDEYELEEDVHLTLNIEYLKRTLKKAKATDEVFFYVEKENINRLKVIIRGKGTKEITLPILESEIKEIPPLNLDFSAKAEIISELFAESIEDAGDISDVVSFEFNGKDLVIEASNESSTIKTKLNKEVEGVIDITSEGTISAKYSVDYLKKIIKAKKIAPTVVISIDTNAPARFEYKNSEDLWMSYILAPRVEE